MIIANSALRATLAIHHLICNKRWRSSEIYLKLYFLIFKPYVQYGKLCAQNLIQDQRKLSGYTE